MKRCFGHMLSLVGLGHTQKGCVCLAMHTMHGLVLYYIILLQYSNIWDKTTTMKDHFRKNMALYVYPFVPLMKTE